MDCFLSTLVHFEKFGVTLRFVLALIEAISVRVYQHKFTPETPIVHPYLSSKRVDIWMVIVTDRELFNWFSKYT